MNKDGCLVDMKIEIPIVGVRNGKIVVDDFFENVCRFAGISTGTIVGCPSKNIEDNLKLFILINDNMDIQKRCESIPQEILNIYPNRPRKKMDYFFEINIDNDKLDLLTEEELKLVKMA